MRLTTLLLWLLPLPLAAQNTVAVEDAPFKEAGALSSRLDSDALQEDGYTPLPPAEITTERLSTAEVLDVAGNRIGNAQGVLVENGEPLALVFEVGGVFGVFERPVAVPLVQTDIGVAPSGAVRVVLDVTAEELRAMDRYEGPALTQ